MSTLKNRWIFLALILPAILLISAPYLVTTPFARRMLILIFMWSTLGLAWNLVGGYAGQVSLGHAIYFGIGAYTSSMLLINWGISPWLGMLVGMLFAVVVAVIIGYPTFKLAGHYFAIATIAAGEIVAIAMRNWKYVGGSVGLYLPIIRGDKFLDFQFHESNASYYYIILGMLILTILISLYVERSRFGYYFRAIREEPDAARSLGIDLTRYKMIAMILSSALTAMVGTFYAQFVLYVGTEGVLALTLSIQMVLVAVLGGTGSIAGPIVGALALIPMEEYTRVFLAGKKFFNLDLGGIHLVIFGLLIVLVAIFQPSGLVGWLRGLSKRWRFHLTKFFRRRAASS